MGVDPNTSEWHPIGTPTEIAPAVPAARKRSTRRGRRSRRGKSRKYRR